MPERRGASKPASPKSPIEPPLTGTVTDPDGTTTTVTDEQGMADLERLDARNKVGNTAKQGGIGLGVIILVNYLAGFAKIDLDPFGPGTTIPSDVAGAIVAVGATLLAGWMHRDKLRR